MDVFDRIAAALKLLATGTAATDPAVTEHLKGIDDHLVELDKKSGKAAKDAGDEDTRLSTIEAGLAKIAAAIDPASPAAGGDGNPASPPAGGATDPAPATDPAATPPVDGQAPTDAAGNPVNDGTGV